MWQKLLLPAGNPLNGPAPLLSRFEGNTLNLETKGMLICTLKAGLKLLFLLTIVAQISSAFASTEYETNIEMREGQLVLPNREIQITTGRSRFSEDQEALSKVGSVTKIKPDGRQCVKFAREETGKSVWNYALKDNKVNSDSPEINAVVQTSEGNVGHLARVTSITISTITIREGNYIGGWETERVLLKNDPRIVGYIT